MASILRTQHSMAAIALPIMLTMLGCTVMADTECQTSQDCPPSEFCKLGACTNLDDNSPFEESGLVAEDQLSDAGHLVDGGLTPHPCPDASVADHQNLVLNELLATVPMGPDGDANGDGVRHFHDDEFIELVNSSDEIIDLTGVSILNDTTVRHIFPETCLEPLHAVVVFGGIEPGAELPAGEGYRSYAADSRLAYADGGGRAVVRGASGDIIADYTYGSHPAESLNLDEDIHGDSYQSHGDLNDSKGLFSPGTCANGLPFPTGCSEDGEENDDEKDLNDFK